MKKKRKKFWTEKEKSANEIQFLFIKKLLFKAKFLDFLDKFDILLYEKNYI